MNQKQRDLLFQAKMDVATAKRDLKHGALRAAASRAYYAMFYVATALLLEKDLSFSKHTAVIAAYGKHFAGKDGVPVESHRYLLDAMDKRGIADYDFNVHVTPEVVETLISHAELFIHIGIERLGDVSEYEE